MNTQLMLMINSWSIAEVIGVASVLSAVGSYWGAPVVALLLFYWRARVGTASAAIAPFRFLVAFAAAMLTAAVAKPLFAFPRPADVLGHELLWVASAPGRLNSFPSGHAVYTAVVVAIVFPLVRWPWKCVLLVLAGAVGWSRVALGAHFPVDVVAGFMLGATWVAVTRRPAEALAVMARRLRERRWPHA
ncbi:phosphatase PAP2 family protein [Piscinibacter koreensis]|uniref:Phosphatase PAP2 family protein n=1 Tax=Piscinibacter koreensis TaxID=2742824 RepID=A0A7Y6NSA9_9BURK|nr:phosphatase PAP2 family protein [Schlegelella koreensis]NUZ08394.1 phosphatase PAP2 family protein [Schlegelella koreensis]